MNIQVEPQALFIPRGFRFSAATAGIKASGSPDLALAISEHPASAAAMFTTNRVTAAPLILSKQYLEKSGGRVRAVIVNSGNANCATGREGERAAEHVCRAVAAVIECPVNQVFPSSTGIIGVPLPAEKLSRAVPALIESAEPGIAGILRFAHALMTTDTRPKIASADVRVGNRDVALLGVAKGAGMIHPRLATMLVYLFTDADSSPGELRQALRDSVAGTFNRISVDGDTSTNDTVLLLAGGASGARWRDGRKQLQAALTAVCESLARQIVADAEGVRHVLNLTIERARRDEDAERVARAIANSPLVKTAFAGADPNWGRILAAAGYSGAPIDPAKIDIWFGPHQVCKRGMRARYDEAQVHAYLRNTVVDLRMALNQGRKTATFWTCDLTEQYVHINADYST